VQPDWALNPLGVLMGPRLKPSSVPRLPENIPTLPQGRRGLRCRSQHDFATDRLPDGQKVSRGVLDRANVATNLQVRPSKHSPIQASTRNGFCQVDVSSHPPGENVSAPLPRPLPGTAAGRVYAAGFPNCSRRKASRNSLMSPSKTLAGLFDRHIVR